MRPDCVTDDVIIEINHQPVANADDAVRLCKAARGDQIIVKVWRQTGAGPSRVS